MKKSKNILPSGRGRASHKEPQHGKGGIQARIWPSPWLLDRAGDMGFTGYAFSTIGYSSKSQSALITAVTKTKTEIFQAADEITPFTLVAAARRTLTRGRLTPRKRLPCGAPGTASMKSKKESSSTDSTERRGQLVFARARREDKVPYRSYEEGKLRSLLFNTLVLNAVSYLSSLTGYRSIKASTTSTNPFPVLQDNPGSDPDWFRYQSIQGEVACLVVRIHRGLWHKFEEIKGTLPMTEEGRPLRYVLPILRKQDLSSKMRLEFFCSNRDSISIRVNGFEVNSKRLLHIFRERGMLRTNEHKLERLLETTGMLARTGSIGSDSKASASYADPLDAAETPFVGRLQFFCLPRFCSTRLWLTVETICSMLDSNLLVLVLEFRSSCLRRKASDAENDKKYLETRDFSMAWISIFHNTYIKSNKFLNQVILKEYEQDRIKRMGRSQSDSAPYSEAVPSLPYKNGTFHYSTIHFLSSDHPRLCYRSRASVGIRMRSVLSSN
ncbi:hypothetical protein M5K25_028333 [Dendrobium thyrsiflorum]|uniref:Uncharacterized protein n=1 Tax=Dendrobium thyrsiflorum TaxID=117978 RepID=A0ABD0TTI1_DENTH